MNKILFSFLILFTVSGFSQEIKFIQLTPNAWLHVTYSQSPQWGRFSSNGLIFKDEGKAFLFDTPMTDEETKVLYDRIRDSLNLTLAGFVPNHWHNDCMGGLGYLQKQKVPSWANQKTIEIAKAKRLPVPGTGFTDSLLLWLNDKEIRCFYFGAGHSSDNIVVWIPSEKILFAGCMVKEMSAETPGNTADADLKAWPETLNKVRKRFPDARIVIPGHGTPGGLELIDHTLVVLSKHTH